MKTSASCKSLLVLSLLCTIFTILFSFTLSNMMGPYIVGDLGGSTDIATYTLSFFGVGNALGIPLGATFPGRIGPRKFFVGCLLLFGIFSLGCAIAPTYPVLLFFRFLEGFISGPLYALIPLVLRLIPKEERSTFTAYTITIFTVVPVLGACWGGWLSYDYHWQWGFTIETVVIVMLAVFLWIELGQYELSAPKEPFNARAYFFYFIGLLSLSIVVITGQELDWYRSPLVILLSLIGVPCFLFFLIWDWHHPYPLLKLHLLKKGTISFALVNLAMLFSVYFGTIILLALWLNLDVSYTPIWIGYLIGIMGIIGLLPTILIREKFRMAYFDTRITLGIAISFFAISSFHTMFFNEEINFGRIALSRLSAGFGLAFFLPPLFRLCFRSCPEEEGLHLMVIFQVVRALASGLGVAVFTTIWLRRHVFYHQRLGGALTPLDQETTTFFEHAKQFQLQGLEAKDQLNVFLDRRSTALALDDVFYLMVWLMIGLLVLLILTFFFRARGFIPENQEKNDEIENGKLE